MQDNTKPAQNTSQLAVRKAVRKFGRNPAMTTTSFIPMTPNPAPFQGFLTVAETVRVRAGGAPGDNAGGFGARKIIVQGLNQNWDEAEEEITLAGAAASASTTTTFIRLHRAFVSESGTYSDSATGANNADISIETTSGALLLIIVTSQGQTEHLVYTIPRGYKGYIVSMKVSATTTSSYRLFQRENAEKTSAPFGPKRLVEATSTFLTESNRIFSSYYEVPERTDVWLEGTAAGGSAVGYGTFEIYLV